MRRLVLWLPLLGLAVLAGALAIQNRSLRALHVRTLKTAVEPHPGVLIPTLALASLAGDSVILGAPPPGETQVLIGFTTTCPFCLASLAQWDTLAQRALQLTAPVQLIGVSMDSLEPTRRFAEAKRLRFPVVVLPPRWYKLFRFSLVPAIIVVDTTGMTVFARMGVLTAAGRDSLLGTLNAVSVVQNSAQVTVGR